MEHSLHIACKHFVEIIAPASPATIRKKVHVAIKTARGTNRDLDLDKLATLDLKNAEELGDLDSNSDDEVEFTHGDALGKALALVKQVGVHIYALQTLIFSIDSHVTQA
jgi:hypothetical protein